MNPQYEYVDGQFRPHFPALLATYQQRSDELAARHPARLNLPYGPHPRQRFDHFPCQGRAMGTLMFFHAGYWQSRDKANFRFLAAPFQTCGLHVFMINYPLCPTVTLAQLEQAVLPSVAAVRRELGAIGVGELPLAVLGHSAGAHLAVLLALAGSAPGAAPEQAVDGVWGISGVYSPEPLLATTLNDKLQLDATAARNANVCLRVAAHRPPGLWMVGGAETASFAAQNTAIHAAWRDAGQASHACTVAAADHFTVLESVAPAQAGEEEVFEAWWREVLAYHHRRHLGGAAPA